MVVFDGTMPHHTSIKSGTVRLAGAFDLKNFAFVGHAGDDCLDTNDEPDDDLCIETEKCECIEEPDRRNLFEDAVFRKRQRVLETTVTYLRQAHEDVLANENDVDVMAAKHRVLNPKSPKAPKAPGKGKVCNGEAVCVVKSTKTPKRRNR